MFKKITYFNKSITKIERGLFFDSFKHLKVNLSTLLEHFYNTGIYNHKCFIRNEKIFAIESKKEILLLDAAHIVPYNKGGSFSINNGILLSFDLHKLFDMGFITIKYKLGKFYSVLSSRVEAGSYLDYFSNLELKVIPNQYTPNILALEYHNTEIFK